MKRVRAGAKRVLRSIFVHAWPRAAALASCATVVLAAVPCGADEPRVTITGGADETGHNYTWVVTNFHTSPLVYVEMPHFQADVFTAPDGWTLECKNLVNVGVRDPVGTCKATASTPDKGIRYGSSGEFTMRISRAGAPRAPQTATVRFADGSEIKVPGVELPRRPTSGETFEPLIGLAAVLGVVFLAQWWRRRKARRSAVPTDQSGPS